MARYVFGRVVQAVFSLLFVTLLIFLLVRLTGDPTDVLVPDHAPIALQERVRQQLGLDRPVHEQYAVFLGNLANLNLGVSYASGRPVTELLVERFWASLSLAAVAMAMVLVIGVPLGILAAVHRGKVVDTFARTIALLGQSVPSFWLAIMLILVFGVALRWFPVAQRGGPESYVLPALAMSLAVLAGIVRLLRSSMLEALDTDYVRMARAKGLPERTVVTKHALRNALIPVLTLSGLILAGFMNGSVIIENVFAWPGLGKLVLDGVTSRDFPVVQGVVLATALIYVVLNLGVDILTALIDPRIRYR